MSPPQPVPARACARLGFRGRCRGLLAAGARGRGAAVRTVFYHLGMQSSRLVLDAATLHEVLPALGCQAVEVLDQTTSTNTVLAERLRGALAAGDEVPEFSVLLAEEQTQGKGRLDRAWGAPRSSQLILSLGVRLPGSVAAGSLGLLPLLTGVAVVNAVRSVSAAAGHEVPATLKWPNDVIVKGRKLAGILVEAVQVTPEPVVVIGVGLNMDLTREELPVPHATSLALEGMPMASGQQAGSEQGGAQDGSEQDGGTTARTRLAIALVEELIGDLRRFARMGGAPQTVLPGYRQLAVTLGSKVTVHLPDGSTPQGVARDVDDTGALVVDAPDKAPLVVAAGDVTHLRPAAEPAADGAQSPAGYAAGAEQTGADSAGEEG